MTTEDLPRWLAVATGAHTVRLVPVTAPSTGPDVFCKLLDAEAAIASAVAAERERCAKAAERWGLARQPEYGGTALMNFASELRAGRA